MPKPFFVLKNVTLNIPECVNRQGKDSTACTTVKERHMPSCKATGWDRNIQTMGCSFTQPRTKKGKLGVEQF